MVGSARVGWVVLLLVAVAAGVSQSDAQEPPVGTSVSTTSTMVSPYGADPLGLVAHVDRLRRHSVGRDVWQVWVCELEGESMRVDPGDIVDFLTEKTRPYFWWLSDGRYNPVFVAGGEPVSVSVENLDFRTVEMGCVEAVKAAINSGP